MTPLADRSKVSILLVEDNEINRDVALNIVEMYGYQCEGVPRCKDALRRLCEYPYDIILMDCQMPEMDGFETTRRIREMEARGRIIRRSMGRIPIVALTANALEGDRDRCLAAGMDDYLTKPFQGKELIAILNSHLRSAKPIADVLPARPLESQESVVMPVDSESTAETKAPAPLPLDLPAYLERCAGNRDLAKRLVLRFEEEAGKMLDTIRQIMGSGDCHAAVEHVHKLKGVAGNLAFMTLHAKAQELESILRNSALKDAAASLDQLCREVKECMAAVPQVLESIDGSRGDGSSPGSEQCDENTHC